MKKSALLFLSVILLAFCFSGCGGEAKTPKIGAVIGVGEALRWPREQQYMEERAKELGVPIEVRLHEDGGEKLFREDCMELIDSGIDVLIVRARDADSLHEVAEYARQKKVGIISYAGLVVGEPVDLFVGYDCRRIGQRMGEYLADTVPKGDYILLSGDPGDQNVSDLLYDGALDFLRPMVGSIHVLLDESVPGWSTETAKKLVREALSNNGNRVDAILAPNDQIAGACAEVLEELGVEGDVVITGMDAELEAARRIVAGTQSCTVYMDLKTLAHTAVDQAVNLAKGRKPEANAELDNASGAPVPANLIAGQLVTKKNLDEVLIDSGYFTRDAVYGPS